VTRNAFGKEHPRRGSRQDVAIRKYRLKKEKTRLPRKRDMAALETRAVEQMQRANSLLGVYRRHG
jgi:hypothetical protein